MTMSDQEPSLRDLGLPFEAVANLARIGIVFDSIVTYEDSGAEKDALPDGADPNHTFGRLRLTGGILRLYQNYSQGEVSEETYDRTMQDAFSLPADHFMQQYPELGPY